MNRVMKEANDWIKKYTGAFKKHGKVLIEVLIKKQAYENKIRMEIQQQQMYPMLIYKVPLFMLWIFVLPAIFGATTSLSPIRIPWIMSDDKNVSTDTQLHNIGQPKGSFIVSLKFTCGGGFLSHHLRLVASYQKLPKPLCPA